jgi:dipeptidyl aminopeptidase/acylaminoacyl peptidase
VHYVPAEKGGIMRRGVNLLLAAAIAAAWGTCASAQTQPTLEQDAVAFGTRETTTDMDLSPDGKLAVFLGAGPGRATIVYIADLTSGTTKRIFYSSGNPDALRWCNFVSNTRLACQFTAIVKSGGGSVSAGTLLPISRMMSVNIDGTEFKELGQTASDEDIGLRQFDGNIIDWRPGGENEVLMTRLFLPEGSRGVPTNIQRTKSGIGVVRLNVATLATKTVEPPRDSQSTWMSDGRGQVRLHGIAELSSEEYTTGRVKYAYRPKDSNEWKSLTDYVDGNDFEPLAIDVAINSLYALRKHDGRLVLTKTELDDSPVETIVAQNPRVDIDDVVRSGDGQRVIGYTYAEDYRHTVYFDPEYKTLSSALSNALPNHPDVTFTNASSDGSKVLLFAGSDRDPGRYYLFNKTNKSLGELMSVRPNLAGRTLAEVKPITYAATDGTTIPAYLTLPPGKEAKNLPAIVMPHGGPSARDEWGFDWLPQFLAARGYVVIQPQYRGSGGFGDAWMAQNGFKGWRTSIGDISAAARYLAKQGLADPNRIAIVGWSYGGYAALQSAATEPSLYKAVIAIAPVTDLALLKTEALDYTSYKQTAAFIGDGPHLVQGSPARQATAIQVPVLLVHGDLDVNVNFEQSQRMQQALQSAGKQSEFLAFHGLDHQLKDNEARSTMLLKMGQLLDRTIGH